MAASNIKIETLFTGKAWVLEKAGAVGILSFDLQGQRVNKLSDVSLGELGDLVDRIQKGGDGFKSVMLRSKKIQSYVVGADIQLIQTLKDQSQAEYASSFGQKIFSKLEDLSIPTIAVIDGACMGGGTEMSLACDYRICSDFDKTMIALPEVKLGLLPGWGGTYRLPKLVGLMASIDMILTGKNIRPDKALKMGLVDAVIPSAILSDKALEIATDLASGKGFKTRRHHAALQEKVLTENFAGRMFFFHQARKQTLKTTRGHYPSPMESLGVLEKTYGMSSREKAMDLEAHAFGKLWATSESKNLVNLFFLSEDAKKNSGTSLSEEQVKALPPVQQMAVLGAGVMGGGIAAQAATRNIRVLVKDIQFEAVAKGLAFARKLFDGEAKKKRIKPAEVERRMAHIRGQIDFTGFASNDLVIEAVVENVDIKRKVFAELETKVGPKCLIASNTSSIKLSQMADSLKDPSRFVGLHFFNPVHKMPLVEVIAHPKSSAESVARAVQFAKAIGKTPVVVQDGPGFLVNRLLMPWLNEAGFCLTEGFSIELLDKTLKKFGMPMGPCELIDEVGIDVASKVSHILHNDFGDRAKPAPAVDRVMEANKGQTIQRLGRKSGLGFYKWDGPGGRRVEPDVDAIEKILFASGSKPTPKEFTPESLVRRMIYPMINEAARALDEKIVAAPADCDLAMIFGTGFPPFRGGLLRYADSVGLKKIVAELDRLAEIHGERMKPSDALRKFANERGTFYT